jgi:hypothetical protein
MSFVENRGDFNKASSQHRYGKKTINTGSKFLFARQSRAGNLREKIGYYIRTTTNLP